MSSSFNEENPLLNQHWQNEKSDNVLDSEVLSKVRDTVVEKEGGPKLSVNKVLLHSSTIWVEIYLETWCLSPIMSKGTPRKFPLFPDMGQPSSNS